MASKRKKNRKEAAPAPAPRPAARSTVQPNKTRDPQQVNAALQEARVALPDHLFTPGQARYRHTSDLRMRLSDRYEPEAGIPDARTPTPSRGLINKHATTDGPNLRDDKRLGGCKNRPSSNRRGNGASRSFIPWCK